MPELAEEEPEVNARESVVVGLFEASFATEGDERRRFGDRQCRPHASGERLPHERVELYGQEEHRRAEVLAVRAVEVRERVACGHVPVRLELGGASSSSKYAAAFRRTDFVSPG